MSNVTVAITRSGSRYILNRETCVLIIRRSDSRGGEKIGFDYTVPEGRFENVEAYVIAEGSPAHFRTKQGDVIRTSPVIRTYEAVMIAPKPRPLPYDAVIASDGTMRRPVVQFAAHGRVTS